MHDEAWRTPKGLLTLAAIPGIGLATAERLVRQFPNLEAIVDAHPDQLRTFVSSMAVDALAEPLMLEKARSEASEILDRAAHNNIRVLSIFDADYPEALRCIIDYPPILYMKGRLPGRRCVACVGTREPSQFGINVAEQLVNALVAADWTIVSGLAAGIDTVSHNVALAQGGVTLAVVAGGLDKYPNQNLRLAEAILAGGGAMISEQAFGVQPSARNLVMRNRLQSGLSVATFVMQTDIKGGSMHTARFAVSQNRMLFAPVPKGHDALETMSRGILAMTQLPAAQFTDAVQADANYRRILSDRIPAGSVARPLIGVKDYAPMLEDLERRLGSQYPRLYMPGRAVPI